MITQIEPKVNPTARYCVKETSVLLGIHRHTLRRYTVEGLIKCGFRRANGRVFYKGSDILCFWRGQL